jgi:protein-disulfide isomerase
MVLPTRNRQPPLKLQGDPVRRIYSAPSLLPQVLIAISVLWGGIAAGASAQGDGVAARTKGSPDAPVVIYEMSDFQCPYCRDFALGTMPGLDSEYIASGKVRFTFINLPLTNLHPNTMAAAEVAMCAARQGKFWPVHDRLFQRQPQWAERKNPAPYLLALADSAGVNHAQLAACVASGATRPAIEADAVAAHRAGAHSTPTFYIEGGLIEGAAPLAAFRAALDSVYRSKTASAH